MTQRHWSRIHLWSPTFHTGNLSLDLGPIAHILGLYPNCQQEALFDYDQQLFPEASQTTSTEDRWPSTLRRILMHPMSQEPCDFWTVQNTHKKASVPISRTHFVSCWYKKLYKSVFPVSTSVYFCLLRAHLGLKCDMVASCFAGGNLWRANPPPLWSEFLLTPLGQLWDPKPDVRLCDHEELRRSGLVPTGDATMSHLDGNLPLRSGEQNRL